MNELINAVLDWWKEHEYDTGRVSNGDGTNDEYNVYSDTPKFVKIALKLKINLDISSTMKGEIK